MVLLVKTSVQLKGLFVNDFGEIEQVFFLGDVVQPIDDL